LSKTGTYQTASIINILMPNSISRYSLSMMRNNQLTFVLAVMLSICGVCPDHTFDISDNDVVTSIDDHRLHKFEEQKHIEDLIAWKDWKEQEAWKDYCKASETFDPQCIQYVRDQLTRRQFDIADRQGESETMMMILGGLTLFAAGAATVALVQNAQQTTDFDALKSRVSTTETDQTSICTTVKAFQSSSSGKTITGGYTETSTTELGYLTALAAVTAPTCS